jgi:TENA/THI-4/PQQC family protein
MSSRFTSELWKGIGDIYSAILVHPFLTGLTDGSLPHGTFAFYVVQDALYLGQYAQALAAVASRAPDNAGTEMFARHATPRPRSRSSGRRTARCWPASVSTPPPPVLPSLRQRRWPTPVTCWRPSTAGPTPTESAQSCRVTRSTGRSAGNCCAVAHPTRGISGGSTYTAARSSASLSAQCWPWPMR